MRVLRRGLGQEAAGQDGAAQEVEALARGDGDADGTVRKAGADGGVGEGQVGLGQHVDPLVRTEPAQQLLPNGQLQQK